MKQVCLVALSLLSLMGIVCAQQNNPGRPEGNPGRMARRLERGKRAMDLLALPARRQFEINLGKGNRLVLVLAESEAVNAFVNIDSLLQVFLLDMVPLKDSFADPLSTKRVEYVTDRSGSKKIQFRQFRPVGSNFLLNSGVLSTLKTEQDTLILSGVIGTAGSGKGGEGVYPYRLTFYLNQASELADYIDGRLNEKMREIQANPGGKPWMPDNNNWYYLMSDTSVWVKKVGGAHFRVMSYLGPDLTVNLQNYKGYFVPSVSLGMAVVLNNGIVRHDIGVFWEPQFLFAKNPVNNQLTTYRNDFITLSYKLGSANKKDIPPGVQYFSPFITLGYLYHRQGDYYDPHTFRLGLGRVSLKERATLQPELYFHDFFRGVTPGLRLTVSFL